MLNRPIIKSEYFEGSFNKNLTLDNVIKKRSQTAGRSRGKRTIDTNNLTSNTIRPSSKQTIDLPYERHSPNFWPRQSGISFRKYKQHSSALQVTDFESSTLPKTSELSSFRINNHSKNVSPFSEEVNHEAYADDYRNDLEQFRKLYQQLSYVLASTKTGQKDVIKAIGKYQSHVTSSELPSIDKLLQISDAKLRSDSRSKNDSRLKSFSRSKNDAKSKNKHDSRLENAIRRSRINESVSIAYLFLETVQRKIKDRQSYLVNLIGHCLGNLLLLIRVYIIKHRRGCFQTSQFETSLCKYEHSEFGESLTSLSDIILRIQHNNEILSNLHRRVSRFNVDFQSCVEMFSKSADRHQYSCSFCTHRVFQFVAMYIHESGLTGFSSTLQIAPKPYALPAEKDYTIVIEPWEVLMHQDRFRPHYLQFVEWAAQSFNIVLWTCKMPYEVSSIVETLNPYLSCRLYRYHCQIKKSVAVKDLKRLGHELNKTVMIDFHQENFDQSLENGISVKWNGTSDDKGLLVLCEILMQMVQQQTTVQATLKTYKSQLGKVSGNE